MDVLRLFFIIHYSIFIIHYVLNCYPLSVCVADSSPKVGAVKGIYKIK